MADYHMLTVIAPPIPLVDLTALQTLLLAEHAAR